jgi:hypothetical protein
LFLATSLYKLEFVGLCLTCCVFPAEWDTYNDTRKIITQFYTEEEHEWIILDQCSRTTDCNVDHALAILAILRPDIFTDQWRAPQEQLKLHIVTNSWHIPRALILVQKHIEHGLIKADDPVIRGVSVLSAACYYRGGDNRMTMDHMSYGIPIAHTVIHSSTNRSIWYNAENPLWRKCGRELRSVSDNMSQYAAARIKFLKEKGVSNDESKCLRALKMAMQTSEGKDLLNLMIEAYPNSSKAASSTLFPLAHIPFGPRGSYALHYAASYGQTQLCKDLVFFYGASLLQLNAELQLPRDFASSHHHHETLHFLEEATELMHPWWAPGSLN